MEPNRQDCPVAPERSPTVMEGDGSTQRDRRMQLRAYNHWASLLGRRRFPTVADLASGEFCEIAPHSVLLDVSVEAETPSLAYLGERLAGECAAPAGTLQHLEDAPSGSLLARLSGHYRTVLLNRAPTGFEAEFPGLRGENVLYRGILLPFSSDDITIDFVLAVINWKEDAARPCVEEGDQPAPDSRRAPSPAALLTGWADGPGSELGDAPSSISEPAETEPALPGDEAPLPGEPADPALPAELADQLRLLPLQPFTDLPASGPEFALALIRRPVGNPAGLLGEVPHDLALIEQAARRLAC